jgi:hypothetical protein
MYIIITVVIFMILCVLVFNHTSNSTNTIESTNTRSLRTTNGFDCASGSVTFEKKDFQDATKNNLQYIKRYVKFPKHFEKPKVVKSLGFLDMTPNAKVEVEITYVTNKGFWMYIYTYGNQVPSKMWPRYWYMTVNWFVYNDDYSFVQSKSDFVIQSNLNRIVDRTTKVKFDKPFKTVPKVALWLTGFSAGNSNLLLWATNITKEGFELRSKNHKGKVYWTFIYDYIAFTDDSPIKLTSSYKYCYPSTKECSGINTGKNGWRTLNFNTEPGNVRLTGVRELNYENHLRVAVSNNPKGNQTLKTWADTKLWFLSVHSITVKK